MAAMQMQMQDPILEALTFAYENSDLLEGRGGLDASSRLGVTASSSSNETAPGTGPSTSSIQLRKAVDRFIRQGSRTPCPFIGCNFGLEGLTDPLAENGDQTQVFLKHLLVEHNLVIDEVRAIANLHRYILHWKERFAEAPLTDFCVSFWMDYSMTSMEEVNSHSHKKGPDSAAAAAAAQGEEGKERHQYFMLTNVVPEDKELRATLWAERLEAILEINRLEREQTDFSRHCLFCREVCTGNRRNLFRHMADDHAFHIGQPDNIVLVDELINLIEAKLVALKCICCEKTFKDRAILKEHMRKKQHKTINPLNPEYDRFYIVNYLEPGKTWPALDQEDPEDDRVEEDWVEMKHEPNHIVCLLCSQQSKTYEDVLSHMLLEHKFDFTKITENCNFYQKVKIVNFIRRNIYINLCLYCEKTFFEKSSLQSHILEHQIQGTEFPSSKVWDQPEHFFPTYENDHFLMFLDKRSEGGEGEESESAMELDTEGETPVVIPEEFSEIQAHPHPAMV